MIGTKLAHYEITSHLGSGGMGDVYQATDSKLSRSVAVKFLPEAFARDADRVTRFEREARVLASLNHPNIAAIYGLEDTDGKKFLVMELVAGETLAERIQRGPIPVEEALGIAKQIAEALEAAHEKGIIHRDLKPANVKMTPDGKVKVLDFGLAKAYQQDTANRNLSNSPTVVSMAATHQGVILGTAAYMSPEQAKGLEADARSDVFSFGCVLYEMLTGRQAFTGDTIAEVIAALLTREPDLDTLSPNLDPRITDLLRRCIEKNLKRRWHDVADIRLEIEAILADPRGLLSQTQTTQTVALYRPLWKKAIPVALAFVMGTALAAAVLWTLTPSPPAAVTRFPFTLPEGQQFTNLGRQLLSIARDGRQFVYVANQRLYVKPMSELSSIVVQGTAIPPGVLNPVFSPDGRSLIFYANADKTIKRIAVSGGVPVTVAAVAAPFGMSWGPDNWILVGQGNQGIVRISANGGRPETIVSVKQSELAHGPQLLPGANAVLFTLATAGAGNRWDSAQIVAQSLKSGERKVLIDGGSDARYLPTGHLIYVLNGTLLAVPFDAKRLTVTGAAVPIVEGIRWADGTTGTSQFSVSDNGSLIYIRGPAGARTNQSLIALIDQKGTPEPLRIPPGPYAYPRISPDGKQVAFESDDNKEAIIWIYELSGATSMRRLTFGGKNRFPLWSADGQRIVFQSDREGDLGIFWQRADGAGVAERLTKPEQGESHVPESWPAKGERFSFSVIKGSTVSLSTFSPKDKKVLQVEGIQSSAQVNSVFSPDGRWLAYYSLTPGDNRDVLIPGGDRGIFVQPFPPTGAKYQIWDASHFSPVWSPDGKYLYSHPSGGITGGLLVYHAVSITTQPAFAFGSPAVIPMGGLRVPATGHRTYDVTPDGKRFIGVTAVQEAETNTNPEIQIVLNWFQDLKQRVAAH